VSEVAGVLRKVALLVALRDRGEDAEESGSLIQQDDQLDGL